MAHDVFISYSHLDKTVADAVCAHLEMDRIRCWIAPRDIRPGQDWSSSIISAIENCKIMVVIFSSNSNNSQQVLREIERAVKNEKIIIPFKIDNCPMSKSMEYFLSVQHWLDALTQPIEKHIARLSAAISKLIQPEQIKPPTPRPDTAQSTEKFPGKIPRLLQIIIIIAVCLIAWKLLTQHSQNNNNNSNYQMNMEKFQSVSNQRNKYYVTKRDIQTIIIAIESYIVDHGKCPKGGSLQEIKQVLQPTYINILPLRDQWQNEIRYQTWNENYVVASPGSDNKFSRDLREYVNNHNDLQRDYGTDENLNFAKDIIGVNGTLVEFQD